MKKHLAYAIVDSVAGVISLLDRNCIAVDRDKAIKWCLMAAEVASAHPLKANVGTEAEGEFDAFGDGLKVGCDFNQFRLGVHTHESFVTMLRDSHVFSPEPRRETCCA